MIDDRHATLERIRRLENLERTMLALRDARGGYDVLAVAARSLGRDLRRSCTAYELRGGTFRAVTPREQDRATIAPSELDMDALRVRGLVRFAETDVLSLDSEGQVRALLVLDRVEPPNDEDPKYLRAVAAHVSLALANARSFEQLRRYAAEGAALTEAARTILGFTELAPLAHSLCRLGLRLVLAEHMCVYAHRDASLVLLSHASTTDGAPPPECLPPYTASARAQLRETYVTEAMVASRIVMPGDTTDTGRQGLIVFARTQPFEKGELRLIETLVTLAALAIRNVDLYEQATTAARALSESNAFKDDLMAMFAHDFKGPLTVISGFSELLFDIDDPGVHRSAQTIIEQTRRLAKLSDDALALAATQSAGFSLQRAVEDLTEFVRAVALPLDREGDRVVVVAPEEPVLVSFDRSRLRHVFDNVIGNALKYSGGRVEIRVAQGTGEVTVAVIDRGIGIPPGELEKVFSRFGRATNARSRGFSGSGVGLYIAKKIVDVHGGRLDVASEEDEGSTFTVVLPA
jgi:signal transduction histidine kinase